jgi:hypothetical protein
VGVGQRKIMKNVITVLMLVSALVVGCSQAESTTQESVPTVAAGSKLRADTTQVDICEAVLRRHLEITQVKDRTFFVGIKNSDPSPELMSRFASHKPPVKAQSDFAQGDGVHFSISVIKMRSETVAEVNASHVLGTQGRGIYKHTVEKKNGKWVVTKDELLAQS